MKKFAIVDPDWDDATPFVTQAEDPADAVRRYYTGTLLDQPPSLYAERKATGPGMASFGSVGETRVTQFVVTDEEGVQYNIFFA